MAKTIFRYPRDKHIFIVIKFRIKPKCENPTFQYFNMVVGVSINKMKTAFLFKL